jgi:phage I-like protein
MPEIVHALGARRASMFVQLDALRAVGPLVTDDAPKRWMHCAKPGEWAGYLAEDGSTIEFEFTTELFEEAVANFNRESNPVTLTYGHPDYAEAAKIGAPILSAGWIHELEARDDGLWAFVEFTPRAAAHIDAGELRYCSVVLDFDAVDRVSGDSIGGYLYEVGLTNRPFIDGLTPIRLSRRDGLRAAMTPQAQTQETIIMATASEKIASIRNAFNIAPELTDSEAAWAVYDMMCALISYKKAEEILAAPLAFAARSARGLARIGGPKKFSAARKKLIQLMDVVDVDKLKDALAALPEQPTMDELTAMIDSLAESTETEETETEVEETEETQESSEVAAEDEVVEIDDDPASGSESETTEEVETEDPSKDDTASMRTKALSKLGLAEGATDDEMYAAIAAMKPDEKNVAASVSASVQLAQAKIATLNQRLRLAEAAALDATKERDALAVKLEAETKSRALADAAARVDLSIEKGEIVLTAGGKVTREKLIELAATAPETYDLIVSSLEKVPDSKPRSTSDTTTSVRAAGTMTQAQAIEAAQREVDIAHPGKPSKERRAMAYKLAKTQRPELFKTLETAES